ncbi:hypothetical protein KP509_05G094100 [Ceratopteris richardii]|uniref:Integrase catalytic domain-containing protein n=1 Tax=Ceratopteris richardii TaxID=49495 RepID=A0A8T2UVJ5_CERRI|nr:hypothetical protein KP509_05G094100 [Ceratopteris richardii]
MANADGMSQLMSDKLDKNNFHAWRFKMMNFLMGKGYGKYIEGENENDLQLLERNWIAKQVRAYEEWNQGARKVMYWLSVSIQDSMIGHIQNAKTPKEAWNSQRDDFEKLFMVQHHMMNTMSVGVSKLNDNVWYVDSGNIALSMEDGKVKHLADVLHVPNITKNMVSVGQMVDQGLQVRLKLMQSKEIVHGLPKFKVAKMQTVCAACQFGKQSRSSFSHDKHVNLMEEVNTSNEFSNFLKSHGIRHQFSCKYTPQQNGVAERKNRHIADAKEGLNLEPNDKENAEKSSVESQVLSGRDASPSNFSNSNPWSGRLHGNFSPANSSKKGKEKLSAGHKTCAGFEDVDGDSRGSEKSLDEELGLPSVKTPGVRKAHADDTRSSDPGPRRSGRM